MRVLVTRPQPDADAFAVLLSERGFEAEICPMMEVVFHQKPVDLTDIGALAFTSANGVRAFAQNSTNRDLPVYAVGEATAAEAHQSAFSKVQIADGDVESLASLIAARHHGKTGLVLHVAGAIQAGDLAGALATAAVEARRSVLYETRERSSLPTGLLDGAAPPQWATFFSPRTARCFVRLVKAAGLERATEKMKVACLSPAVAEALEEIPWAGVEIAEIRNAAAIVALLQKEA